MPTEHEANAKPNGGTHENRMRTEREANADRTGIPTGGELHRE